MFRIFTRPTYYRKMAAKPQNYGNNTLFCLLIPMSFIVRFANRSQLGRCDRRGQNKSRVRHPRHGQRVDGEQRQDNRLERRQG